jgi:hypothetical protein
MICCQRSESLHATCRLNALHQVAHVSLAQPPYLLNDPLVSWRPDRNRKTHARDLHQTLRALGGVWGIGDSRKARFRKGGGRKRVVRQRNGESVEQMIEPFPARSADALMGVLTKCSSQRSYFPRSC